jgi:hypothetical protein
MVKRLPLPLTVGRRVKLMVKRGTEQNEVKAGTKERNKKTCDKKTLRKPD